MFTHEINEIKCPTKIYDFTVYLHTFEILNVPTYIIFTVYSRLHMNFSQHFYYEPC